MKRPLAYITAAWLSGDSENSEQAVRYCRAVYEAGFSPLCPPLYLPLFLNKPIIEIAFICGYESQQSFSLAFKAMYKSPPAEYREERSFYPLQLRFILHRRTTAMEFTIQDIRLAEKKDIVDWMNLIPHWWLLQSIKISTSFPGNFSLS